MGILSGSRNVNNGLVLHFDAANTRSFKGEPTTNKLYGNFDTTFETLSNGDTAGFTNQLGTGNSFGVTSTMGYKSSKSLKINRGTGGTGRIYRTFSVALGEYSSVSAWVFSMVAGPYITIEYAGGNYNWSVTQNRNTHTGKGWELLWAITTGPATSSTTGYYFLWPSLQNIDTYWDNILVENKQNTTKFVSNSRGTTVATGGGISDLSKNNKHAEFNNGPTYSSGNGGHFIMDGIDDVLLVNQNITNSTQCTVVMWLASTDTQFLWGIGNSGSYYFGASVGGGNYYHENCGSPTYYIDNKLVLNPNGYLDGKFHMFEAKGVDLSKWTKLGFLDYGTGAWNMNGKVAIVQVYNKVLSAAESLQNYNANKYRFI